ncbi:calmodulin-binding protein 25 [Abrus precatorius]|uniref:Calmodulin-binding protein 25 n=1 Tax=Abrus precatorius TaxID=3816 RepID=A0A8B8LC00_ABRPR|nr:calmodulin-binding protein 25 [Abrus precatorius]
MASPENLATIEPWMPRPAVTDSWLAEYIARDADTLTKALQKSFCAAEDNVSPFLVKPFTDAAAATTPTVSSLSGSDQESAPRRRGAVPASGKISKRKSRASKRSQTTFITADPANFRQMVQQVTGVRFGGAGVPMTPAVVKPEPQRAVGIGGGRLPAGAGAGCLPTLDTSALLLEHHQQVVVGPNSVAAGSGGLSGPGPLPFAQSLGGLDAHAASFASAGLDFDTFSSFPTLESWKVM